MFFCRLFTPNPPTLLAMPPTVVASNPSLGWGWCFTSPREVATVFLPCRWQSPPFLEYPLHPLWLQRVIFASCVRLTLPFWAWLVHPLCLQRFFVAPCATQTPPQLTPFSHPSRLHSFLPIVGNGYLYDPVLDNMIALTAKNELLFT